jgi:glucokinase
MSDRYFVGVDLGGTSMRVAIAGEAGELLAHVKAPTHPETGPESVFQRLAGLADEARASAGLKDGGTVAAWGVACPGPVNHLSGVLTTPPNLPGWHNVPVRDLLAPYAKAPVVVANDAHAAALGEHIYGAGRGVSEMVYMTISTGIGGGVISRDTLLFGADGTAGEIGHIVVDWRGPKCNCGNRGCLEALASGTAIARSAMERLQSGAPSTLQSVTLPLSAKDVIEAAHQGDALANEVFQEAARILGAGCVSVVNLVNPRLIVLGGGVSLHAADLLLGPVRERIAQRALELPRGNVNVVLCELGDEAGLYGAIALARQAVS